MDTKTGTCVAPIDCACVIHSNGYDWQYVDRLYSMLSRNLSRPIRFHVYTEADRAVPAHMIRHDLTEWPGIAGPKQSWWYKMQLFDSSVFAGQMLYFDLDVVVTGNLDWILDLPTRSFWAIHDFRRLWKSTSRTINSSVMYFDTTQYHYIWTAFQQLPLNTVINNHKGDQDFVTAAIDPNHLRYFDLDRILSWRWQIVNHGVGPRRAMASSAQSEIIVPESASVVVFHGDPKPHAVDHVVVHKHWC